jgi:hypothetical protein
VVLCWYFDSNITVSILLSILQKVELTHGDAELKKASSQKSDYDGDKYHQKTSINKDYE